LSIRSKAAAVAGVLTLSGMLAGTLASASALPASAATAVVSETTHITSDPDSGGQGNWANDAMTRTLTISVDPGACSAITPAIVATDTCYYATVSDSGTFKTIDEAYQPNQGTPLSNARIAHVVSGKLSGTADFTFYAPTADAPSDTLVPATLSGTPGTSTWFERAFPTATPFDGGINNGWSWTYTSYTGQTKTAKAVACQTWTDSAASGDGQQPAAGNITGQLCAAPPRSETGTVVDFSGKCLDVAGAFGTEKAGDVLQAWTCGAAGSEDQIFSYTAATRQLAYSYGSNHYLVSESVLGGRAVLEPAGAAGYDQTITRSGDRYRFANGAVLDASGFGKSNGTHVLTWAFNGGVNQDWSLPR
jgi:hypothetical protein